MKKSLLTVILVAVEYIGAKFYGAYHSYQST